MVIQRETVDNANVIRKNLRIAPKGEKRSFNPFILLTILLTILLKGMKFKSIFPWLEKG
jgi:hypothetical protein